MVKRCLIMAGGTGGHVFPGLAVGHALKEKEWDVQWLGTAERMEAEIVPKNGFPIHFLPVMGLRGKGIATKLMSLVALFKSIFIARKMLKKIQPDFVLGMGGYASGPGGVAAWSLGIPVVIHEQNAAVGLTNRLLGKIAKRILLGFDAAGLQFSSKLSKCTTVGNPVRESILKVAEKKELATPLNMLVIGGSLGARPLNQIVPNVVKSLEQINVWHQCGKGNQETVVNAYENKEAKVTEFIDNMDAAYEWADFIVCRAGALTVSEVAAAGRAAIFIPLPYAVDDHQTRNAESLSQIGAGVLIPQAALEATLGARIRSWIEQPSKCYEIGKKARTQAKTNATDAVVKLCESLVGGAQ